MSLSGMRGLLAAAAMLAPAPALAQNQAQYPPGAVVQPLDTGPGAELRRNLTTLAENPRSIAALVGAGRATLEMGDAEAAYAFFERAVEVDPGNARAKAGMASALVQLERAREAMPLFAEALALGAPEAELAADRGLAWDSLGEPRRAQADYALYLRDRDDAEVRRRLALSQAISGQREAALRTIDAQLRAQDRAAWRTQAFVLALTGDAAGAERSARSTMPAGGAEAMAPFFARLASLSPAQKAMAVHFGRFPSDGRTAYAANTVPVPQPPPAEPPRPRARPAEPIGSGERVASSITRRAPDQVAPAVTPSQPPPEPEPEPAAEQEASAGFTLVPQGVQPSAPVQSETRSRLDSIAALVASLPEEEARPARAAASQPPPRPAGRTRAPAREPNPARHWVQLATGANKARLPTTFGRMREEAGNLLSGRNAYSARATATNRLLVGPFETERAAQALVNQLRAHDIAAVTWTSEAGQEIERLRIANEPRSSRRRPEPEQRPAARGRRTR